MNIKMNYLYRDAGNNKNWGEIIFLNRNNICLNKLDQEIRRKLLDHQFFEAEILNIPDLHFETHYNDLDHGWHEFHAFTETYEEPTDQKNRDILELLNSLNHK